MGTCGCARCAGRERVGLVVDEGAGARQRIDRGGAGQQVIEGRAQAIEVAARVGAGALHLFERGVVARVAEDARVGVGGGVRLRGQALRQPEVEEHDLAARRELEVLRLDVAVDDGRLVRVQVVERVEQLVGPAQRVRRREGAAFALLEQLREVGALDELHDEELAGLFDEVVAHFRQRGVAQVVQEVRLALEGFAQGGVVEEGLLDGDRAAEALVGGDEDGAHAAVADLSGHAVAVLEKHAWLDHGGFRDSFGGKR